MVNPDDADAAEAVFHTASPDATRALAETLGRLCVGGEVILLAGDLGAGKTCFVQGLARGLDIPAGKRVASPTFTLHGEYEGRLVLNHLDLYRLDDPAQLHGLGIDDFLADPGAVTAVEWPELLAETAGRERLDLRLEHVSESERRIGARASGRRHARLLREWAGGGAFSGPA